MSKRSEWLARRRGRWVKALMCRGVQYPTEVIDGVRYYRVGDKLFNARDVLESDSILEGEDVHEGTDS